MCISAGKALTWGIMCYLGQGCVTVVGVSCTAQPADIAELKQAKKAEYERCSRTSHDGMVYTL